MLIGYIRLSGLMLDDGFSLLELASLSLANFPLSNCGEENMA